MFKRQHDIRMNYRGSCYQRLSTNNNMTAIPFRLGGFKSVRIRTVGNQKQQKCYYVSFNASPVMLLLYHAYN